MLEEKSLFLVRRISEKILTCKEEDIYIYVYMYMYIQLDDAEDIFSLDTCQGSGEAAGRQQCPSGYCLCGKLKNIQES